MTPFGIFAPDQGRYTPGASSYIVNALPLSANNNTAWGPMPDLVEISEALPAEPKGCIAARSSTNTYSIYAFTSTKAYKLDGSDYSWDEVTRLAGGDYALPENDYWSITQHGKYVVATNIADNPQYIDVDVGANFADLGGSPPKARFNWTAGEHLVLGNHASFPTRVQTSGRGDIGFWTVGEKGCDLQDMPDGEDVMGGLGSQRGSIIMQRKAIRHMVLGAVGDYAFKLEVVNANRGCIAPFSIVPFVSGSVAYLSSDGFATGVEGNPIGEGFVDRYYFDNTSADNLALAKGVVDPYLHMIWWRLVLSDGPKLLGYNYVLKRWCMTDHAVTLFVDLATPAITIDGLATLYASMDAITETFDSRTFSGGLPAFAAFTNDYKLGFFTGGDPKAATFDTWEMQLAPGKRSYLREARVVTDASTHTLKVATAAKTSYTEPTFGSAVTPNSSTGICHFRADGLYHKFRLEIPAGEGWNHVLGLEDIRAVPTGRR